MVMRGAGIFVTRRLVNLAQWRAADAMHGDHLFSGEDQGEAARVEGIFGRRRICFRQALSGQIKLQQMSALPFVASQSPALPN